MKLLNQSQLIDGSPYRHLGYTAAVDMLPPVGLVASFVVIIGGIGGLLGARGQGATGSRVASAIALALGVVLAVISVDGWRASTGRAAQRKTSMAAYRLAEAVQEANARGGSSAASRPVLDPQLIASLKDGWGHEMRVASVEADRITISSAGPDGQFGTPDDINIAAQVPELPATLRSSQ